MKRLLLVRWFRRRMLPLVTCSALLVATAAPLAYYIEKRRELWREARADAAQVAEILRGEIEQRPLLWRYNSIKLAERLAEVGLDQVTGVWVHDAAGVLVPVDLPRHRPHEPGRLLYGKAEVRVSSALAATVWVAQDTGPLFAGTAKLAAAFMVLAALLGAVLYLLPMRAIAGAERRIAALMAQLALALQEEDRRRIARDLHDGAGQAITAARLKLLLFDRECREGRGDAAALAGIAAHLDEALDEVRRSTGALTPPALAELGLGGALSRHCEAFAAATGLAVSCDLASLDEDPPLSAPLEIACYRIVQEALANSARHAAATCAWVRLRRSGRTLRLEVGDDGVGWPGGAHKEAVETPGRGLQGICERAQLLGGTVAFTGRTGQGAGIEVVLPVRPPSGDGP